MENRSATVSALKKMQQESYKVDIHKGQSNHKEVAADKCLRCGNGSKLVNYLDITKWRRKGLGKCSRAYGA